MVTPVADKPCGGFALACWNAFAAAFRDGTHAAHEVRRFHTLASDAVEECVFNTAHRIKQHPFAAVGAAFAVGIPAGMLMGWFAGHRSAAAHR